jgi:histidine triad (HIT) family protein
LIAPILRLSRTIRLARVLGGLTGFIFAHMSQLLPLDRLAETGTLIAFRHPQPAYPFHVLIVPKKQVASLEALDPADAAFLSDLYSTVQGLIKQFDLGADGYRLIVNGGKFQDFPQLHFHLISDRQVVSE